MKYIPDSEEVSLTRKMTHKKRYCESCGTMLLADEEEVCSLCIRSDELDIGDGSNGRQSSAVKITRKRSRVAKDEKRDTLYS
jgi:hypothetical protein